MLSGIPVYKEVNVRKQKVYEVIGRKADGRFCRLVTSAVKDMEQAVVRAIKIVGLAELEDVNEYKTIEKVRWHGTTVVKV